MFYVKIQGSFPLTDALRRRLPINRPGTPDVAFAQTFLTATGGHPIALHEQLLLPRGFYPGLARAALDDQVYFTIDSEADLETKWPRILALRPDFIKTNLWFSEEFAQRKNDPAYFGRKALDPALLPRIVRKAHASNLKVSAHVVSGADFHNALAAGVDEIVHVPAAQAVREVEERIYQLASGSLDAQAIQEIAAALTAFQSSRSIVTSGARRGRAACGPARNGCHHDVCPGGDGESAPGVSVGVAGDRGSHIAAAQRSWRRARGRQ